ncbi:syntaxin [Anoplophora glabripennis]|nr:syntaxin [Anoplophora glabripennis]
MAKDRLGELRKVQDKKTNDVSIDVDEDTNPALGGDLKKTFERAEVLGQWIGTVEQNVVAIRQYIGKLDDLSISQKDLGEKIESLFQNNTSICHKINPKFKEMEEELRNINVESAEGRIRSIQYNTLKTRYQKIFRQNSSELENFRNIQKSHLEAQLRAKGVRVTDEELVSLLENNTDIQLFTDNIIAETAEAKRVLADIEERHQQLLKIERMLVEVRDLFLQMAILVDTQQDLIDRVEYQAQAAQNYVGRVPKVLSNAKKKRIKSLKCKIYLAIAITVLVAIILILLFN